MLAKHKIVAMSPEVGINNPISDHFYIPDARKNLPPLVTGFYPTVKYFINMHRFNYKVVSSKKEGKSYIVTLYNDGLAHLYNANIRWFLRGSFSGNDVVGLNVSLSNEVDGKKGWKKVDMKGNGNIEGTTDLNRRSYARVEMIFAKDVSDVPDMYFEVRNNNGKLVSSVGLSGKNNKRRMIKK